MAGNRQDFNMRMGGSWPPGDGHFATARVVSGLKGGPYTPVDITGWTKEAFFNTNGSDDPTDNLLEWEFVTHASLDEADGEFGIRIDKAESAKLVRPGRFNFLWRVTSPDGESTIDAVRGLMRVVQRVG